MRSKLKLVALLAATAVASAATRPARAQSAVAPQSAEDIAAKIALLQSQVDALQAQINSMKSSIKVATPSWKGAPEFAGEGRWRFKPKGLLQFDAGTVENPGVSTRALGFNSRARRLVFGAEGTIPGGFGYNAEFNFANGQVGFEDVVLTYQRSGSPIRLTIGNSYPLSSLETMTSSRATSFLERDQFTDAFGYDRRLGVAVAYLGANDVINLAGGVYTKAIDNSFANNGWQASVRATVAPGIAGGRIHLGANYQHRESSTDALNVRYRARPFTQITDVRFVDTGAIAAKGDDTIGIELGGVFKALHFAGEGQWVKVKGYRPGTVFPERDAVAGGAFYTHDPSFFAGYAEVGYFLTGESRGYRSGRWERTKVDNPLDKGGWGAWQVVGRYSFLDLADRVGRLAGGAASAANLAAPNYVPGGKQQGLLLGVNWQPIDYVRVMTQYGRVSIEGGPSAAVVNQGAGEMAAQAAEYDLDTFTMRAQLEF